MIRKVSDSYKNNFLIIFFGPFLKIIEAIFDLLIPLFMKAIIDLNTYQEPSLFIDKNPISARLAYFIRVFNPSKSSLGDVLSGGIIILLMGITGYIITMCSQYLAAKASINVGTEVRGALYRKVLSFSKKERERFGNGRLLTTINSDTYQLQHGVLLFVRLVVRAPFILIGSLIISFILDWRIGLAFTVIVPLIFFIEFLVLRKSSKGYTQIQNDLDDLSNSTAEISDGGRVVRASNSEHYENSKFENKTKSYMDKSIRVNKINSLINPLTFAITSIVLIVIIYLLQKDLFNTDNTLVISTIIAEMSYLAQIFFVITQLTMVFVEIVKANVCRHRIDAVLTIDPQIVNKDNAKTNEVEFGQEIIKFDHVSFSFDDEHIFLDDLNFQIRKGETFGIIGGTGSGKSTVINLIERYYEATKGNIFYKGIPIKEYNLKALRNDLGLVNQKNGLFNGTIKSNYLMSKEDASDEEIIKSLELAEAYEFVNKLDDGINHVVNEGGTNYSGGQKQRLCIGRALLKNPEVLILDDATSALDLLTDKKIRDHLSSNKKMTKIIVSQRVSTIKDADYILVLDAGKVVGLGKHEDLLKNCSIYQEIYETQIKRS